MNNIEELFASIHEESETQQAQPETKQEVPVKQEAPAETQENVETQEESGESGESEENQEENKEETEKQEKPESRSNKRIRELNDAKKQAESRAAQLEEQLRRIETRKQELDKMADGEKPDPAKFETMQEYLDALTDAKVKAVLKMNEQERLNGERANAENAYVSEIVNTFDQKIQLATQSNPDLPKAVEHLNSIAQYIPVEVRQALLTDDNAAQLAWEIATNQELLDYMCKQNPVNSIKVLAKISSKYDVDEAPQQKAPTAPANKGPVAFSASRTDKPKLPNVPKGGSGSKAGDNLSPSEYYKQYAKGKIDRKPWE